MDVNVKKANELRIKAIIKNLEKRNITGYYCETAEDAANQIKELIPDGAEISWGGSVTLDQIGIRKMLKAEGCNVNDPMQPKEGDDPIELRRRSLLCDVFLSSLNAITMEGEIVNIDGTGNRVAAIAFGPNKVILVAGANKIVRNESDAIDRIKNDACPPNCIRLGKQTPCALTGKCADCMTKGNTICCITTTTRFSGIDDRLHVVLVNENLGF